MSDKVLVELINKYSELYSAYKLLTDLLLRIGRELGEESVLRDMLNHYDELYGIGRPFDFKLKIKEDN